MCELDLYPQITNYFSSKSLKFCEVPFFGKRIDLLYANDSLTTLYSVEAKLSNWKSALRQAAINQVFSHYSFVALPKSKVDSFSKEILSVFEIHGVGLLSIGQTTELILRPQKTKFFNEMKYKVIKKNLRDLVKNNSQELKELQNNGISKRTFTLEFL